jgi:hypothetical protein
MFGVQRSSVQFVERRTECRSANGARHLGEIIANAFHLTDKAALWEDGLDPSFKARD